MNTEDTYAVIHTAASLVQSSRHGLAEKEPQECEIRKQPAFKLNGENESTRIR